MPRTRPSAAVLVGHGHRALGALVVPDAEALEEAAQQRGECLPAAASSLCCQCWAPRPGSLHTGTALLAAWEIRQPAFFASPFVYSAGQQALSEPEVRQLIGGEVRARLAGRVRWEHVTSFEVLSDPFR